MSQQLLWTVGDAVRRYGRQDPLTRQAIKTQHAVDALRAALEAQLARRARSTSAPVPTTPRT